MLNFLRSLFTGSATEDEPLPKPDLGKIIQRIKQVETRTDIEPGRKIYEFDYEFFTLRLDRDITKNYRITVSQGVDRIYSFTITNDHEIEYALHQILDFLQGSRSLKELPNSEFLKGFYFGHPNE